MRRAQIGILRVVVTVLVITVVASCAPRQGLNTDLGTEHHPMRYKAPRGLVTVTWSDYEPGGDLEKVDYIIDGKSVGRGSSGLRAILSKLETLSKENTVFIYPDPFVVQQDGLDPGRSVFVTAERKQVPLHMIAYYERSILYLAAAKGFAVHYLGGAPGRFVGRDGTDTSANIQIILGFYFNIVADVKSAPVRY